MAMKTIVCVAIWQILEKLVTQHTHTALKLMRVRCDDDFIVILTTEGLVLYPQAVFILFSRIHPNRTVWMHEIIGGGKDG